MTTAQLDQSLPATRRARPDERERLVFRRLSSPVGSLIAAATEAGVVRLAFADRVGPEAPSLLADRGDPPLDAKALVHLTTLELELRAYFEGRLRDFSVPVVLAGTPFEQRVWRALLDIPHGETRSYEAIARAIGSPRATRAVGRANGRNQIAIVIPCHRVVNKSGEIGGYGGGIERKQWLLTLERNGGSP